MTPRPPDDSASGASPRVALVMLVLVIAVTAWTWTEVVTRLSDPDAPAARGRPAAIVWSDRVFRSEAELAAWFGRRGLRYERWARAHPHAAAILRSSKPSHMPAR